MRHDDREQIEEALGCEEESAVSLVRSAHHFMIGEGIGRNEVKEPVTVIFDQPVPQFSDTGDREVSYENAYEKEARRFADLMRDIMPQGLRDRVAAHLMGDLMSCLVISQGDLDRRDGRTTYAPNFQPVPVPVAVECDYGGTEKAVIANIEADFAEAERRAIAHSGMSSDNLLKGKDGSTVTGRIKGPEHSGVGLKFCGKGGDDCGCRADDPEALFPGSRVEFD